MQRVKARWDRRERQDSDLKSPVHVPAWKIGHCKGEEKSTGLRPATTKAKRKAPV